MNLPSTVLLRVFNQLLAYAGLVLWKRDANGNYTQASANASPRLLADDNVSSMTSQKVGSLLVDPANGDLYVADSSGTPRKVLKAGDGFTYTDNDVLYLGTGSGGVGDIGFTWDGTRLNVSQLTADSEIRWGVDGAGIDQLWYGDTASTYMGWDQSANQLGLYGPARPRGFNAPSPRFELRWVAGQRGKPGLNADIQNAAEATRMIADPDFELLGTNATSGSSAFYAEGGIVLTTAGADGDEVILVPHLDANQSAWAQVTWGTDREVAWECDIQTGANITNAIVWAGLKLTNTEVTATDNDQVFFRYEDDVNGGKWQTVFSIGGTDTAADSGVTVAVNTRYHLKIVIDSSRVARMYINGALITTSTALTDATDLIPYIGVAADGAGAAKSLRLHSQAISRNIA